jgi:acyl dehydratase
MTEPAKIEYSQLTVGFEFSPQHYTMDDRLVSLYLEATFDSAELIRSAKLVPPMAVTAFAMNALSQSVALPSGTIHVTQELDFIKTVTVGDTIVCHSKVSRKVDRGGMHLMNIDLTVTNQSAETVLTGKVGFILPG